MRGLGLRLRLLSGGFQIKGIIVLYCYRKLKKKKYKKKWCASYSFKTNKQLRFFFFFFGLAFFWYARYKIMVSFCCQSPKYLDSTKKIIYIYTYKKGQTSKGLLFFDNIYNSSFFKTTFFLFPFFGCFIFCSMIVRQVVCTIPLSHIHYPLCRPLLKIQQG